MELKEFLQLLNNQRTNLTKQQYKTIRGQAFAGDIAGARKGLYNLMGRQKKNGQNNH